MAVHKSHGKPRPEVPRADELPVGVAATEAKPSGPVKRDRSGRVLTSEAAKELGRRGGKARAANMSKEGQIRRRLRLHGLVPHVEADSFVQPLLEENERWLQAVMEGMARDVGGGHLSAGVCAILTYAAQDRVMSSFYFELASSKNFAWTITKDKDGKTSSLDPRTELAAKARELGISSRGHLQSAHELAAKEALSRKSAPASTSNALAERVEVLIAAEQANAARWKSQLEQKSASTTVDAPSATGAPSPTRYQALSTDSRDTVTVPSEPTNTTVQNVPAREHASVAPGASQAAPRTSPVHSSHTHAPSPPGGVYAPAPSIPVSDEEKLRVLCREWLAKSPRRTIEDSKRINEIQNEAGGLISGRYSRDQREEDRWLRSQRRGRLNVVPLHVPHPAAGWWASYHENEADYAKRIFKWTFEEEPR